MRYVKEMLLSAVLFMSTTAIAEQLPNFTTLVKDNAKTVVQIKARANRSAVPGRTDDMIAPDDFLRYFFDAPPSGHFKPQPPKPRGQSRSHGSGFFIDNDGYILTNAHVVKGSDDITVSTTDRKEYEAKLVGLDERSDIALLKIEAKNTPSAKLGNSDKAEVGNWVLAIGSPFGFDYTATKGIISAVSRSLPDGTYVPFIQTDAAVNPGNSGGPLFNIKGEVIGVNSQIYSSTGSFNGLAFAVPINTAMNVAKQLREKGFVSRGWLGVAIQNINQDLATSFQLDKPVGALVANVVDNSPADKAGIEAGDIILRFDGQQVIESSDLPPIVGSVAVGADVVVEILRQGKKKTVTVNIGELDEVRPVQAKKSYKPNNKGLVVENLTPKAKTQFNIKRGVVIVQVAPDSPAFLAGFQVGDMIISVNNHIVDNVVTFNRVMSEVPAKKPAAVLVLRNGQALFIPL